LAFRPEQIRCSANPAGYRSQKIHFHYSPAMRKDYRAIAHFRVESMLELSTALHRVSSLAANRWRFRWLPGLR
jgi:surfactin synthase thioesterase subunit